MQSGTADFPNWLRESNNHLVVVAFVADWAGTAEILKGFLGIIAAELPGVTIKWVDVDQNTQLTVEMGVNQIPSVVLLRNQEVVDHIDGLIPRRKLASRIERFL